MIDNDSSRVGERSLRGVNEPERNGMAFQLEFVQLKPRFCSLVTVFQNAVPPAEQKWCERSGIHSVSGSELEL